MRARSLWLALLAGATLSVVWGRPREQEYDILKPVRPGSTQSKAPAVEEDVAEAETPSARAEASGGQMEAAEELGVPVTKELDLGGGLKLKLVLIPAGEFMMGKRLGGVRRKDHEGPQHRVRITKPFHMGATEVTKGQFARFVTETGYRTEAEKGEWAYGFTRSGRERRKEFNWRNVGFAQGDDEPVVSVSWNDAQAFCRWLSGKGEGQARLPTEAQWEYACRAGTRTRFSFGDSGSELYRHGNYADKSTAFSWSDKTHDDRHGRAAPVGSFAPNAWGLYDMHGNVWEWCSDRYGKDYYDTGAREDPEGPATGTARMLRGGSWLDAPRRCRSAFRYWFVPTYALAVNGFRVVVGPGEESLSR